MKVELKRPGAVPALLAAGGVLVFVMAQAILQGILTAISLLRVGGYFDSTLGFGLGATALGALPFVLGVFLSLWMTAPIAPALRIGHVITRSILAAAIGAGFALVFGVLSGWVILITTGQVGITQTAAGMIAAAGSAVAIAVSGAISAFVNWLPHTVLAGVLLWIWLQKRGSAHRVSGLVDEV